MTETVAPLRIHAEPVRSEWIDYNGHMNAAYFVVAFDHATDAFLAHVGLGQDYVRAENRSVFAGESHVCYLQEVKEGQMLSFETLVLGVDPVRIHIFHTMRHAEEGWVAATNELMLLHVNLELRRAGVMPSPIRALLNGLATDHATLPLPRQAGRAISLQQRA